MRLFVVACGHTSSQLPFIAGVPQGGIWSPLLFNLYIRHLPDQILHCDLFQYADDSSLMKVIPSKDDRTSAADELNADLDRIYSWGQTWNINFEPAKCCILCVSLKRDIDLHPPLFMATLPIDEVDVLKILGIYFDRKLLWSHMIDQLVTRCRQHLGALYTVLETTLVRVVLLLLLGHLFDQCVNMEMLFLWGPRLHINTFAKVRFSAAGSGEDVSGYIPTIVILPES